MNKGNVVAPGSAAAFEWAGNRFTFPVRGADSGGAFAVMQLEVAPGFVAPPILHAHSREDWWAQVLEGEIAIQLGAKTHRATAGAWIVVPRGTPFRWWNPRQEPARWLLTYAPAGFEQYFFDLMEAMKARPDATVVELAPPLWTRYGLSITPGGHS
jgi:quercetin dioxygenase-like cupin family protein